MHDGRHSISIPVCCDAGYVMQDDMLNGSLTVLETLNYAAELRLPPTVLAEERLERVNTVNWMGNLTIGRMQNQAVLTSELLCVLVLVTVRRMWWLVLWLGVSWGSSSTT